MSSEDTLPLPRWDMSVIYPGLDSPEFESAFQRLVQDITDLGVLFDTRQVGADGPVSVDDRTIQAFEAALSGLNAVTDAGATLNAYLQAFVTTDSRDTLAQARMSEYEQLRVQLNLLRTRFTAWVGALELDALVKSSPAAAEHAYALQRMKLQAAHLMSPAEEKLAAELSPTGGVAWARLWGDVSSQLCVTIEREGQPVEMPMSALRNQAMEPDREVRRQAYEAELAAWQRVAVPLAAAMNGIKGEVSLLAGRRGWGGPLDTALFENGIDREMLEAMMGAAEESFPIFRRYLRAKARVLCVERLAWYDLFAPVGRSSKDWEFGEAREFILSQFGTYSARLRGLAERAFDERWIDAEPRVGKRDGAYCMWIRPGESRVFANYQPALGGVSTLAHELGHAYHNLNLAGRTPLQRATPMVLAETASIFCETIIRQAALRQADAEEQLAILDNALRNATQVVVDISSRFRFEQGVFDKRVQRELSVDELNDLMLRSQLDTYGDGLDPEQLHPYMWAAKPHYYRIHPQFYNFPYMFGLLFGLGMYARYEADPAAFTAGYDDLLSATGIAEVAELAGRFGIDVRSRDFWRSSLEVVAADVAGFERLANQVA